MQQYNSTMSRKVAVVFVGVFFVGALGLAKIGFRVSLDGIRITRNFHAVDPGKLYRSAQLTDSELRSVIKNYGIKTVINLRGSRPGHGWFEKETTVLRDERVHLINLEMSVESIPKRFELLKLLEAYKNAERPILIHCRSGSDRTGEAVAIYKLEYMGKEKKEAMNSFSFKYFYIEAFAPAKTYFIENYKGKEWAYTNYDHCDRDWNFADQRECPPL